MIRMGPLDFKTSTVDALFGRCRSPIESRFLSGVIAHGTVFGVTETRWGIGCDVDARQCLISVTPGYKTCIDGLMYESDFKIDVDRPTMADGHGGTARVFVEVDGHDFHEKTKEQAARDKSRDRRFAKEGLVVLRFTGAEVHAGKWGCADEAILVALAIADREANLSRESVALMRSHFARGGR